MPTTKLNIKEWLERGKKTGAIYLIVVVDKFDYEDYPVFTDKDEDIRERIEQIDGKPMQQVMEVYKINEDWEEQLNRYRCFNL